MSPTANPPRILVVDDDLAVRELLTEYLATRGYDVVSVADGMEAMAAIEVGDISLVLTDLRIPHPDGLTLLQASRERYPHLPFLMITGYGTVESAVYALKMGANDYLLKPFKLKAVLRSIEQALARSRLDAEVRSGQAALALFEEATHVVDADDLAGFLDRFLTYILDITAASAAAVLTARDGGAWEFQGGAGAALPAFQALDRALVEPGPQATVGRVSGLPAESQPYFRKLPPSSGLDALLGCSLQRDTEEVERWRDLLLVAWPVAPDKEHLQSLDPAFQRASHILAVALRHCRGQG